MQNGYVWMSYDNQVSMTLDGIAGERHGWTRLLSECRTVNEVLMLLSGTIVKRGEEKVPSKHSPKEIACYLRSKH